MRNASVNSSREKAMKLVEGGLVDAYTLLESCLVYMSEDEVGDMLHCNGYLDDDDDDDNDDNDDDDDGDD